jgi:hypothetical protein
MSHITKVMLLSALARPSFDVRQTQWLNGLMGIDPVGELVFKDQEM